MENKRIDFEKVNKYMKMEDAYIVKCVKNIGMPNSDPYKELVGELLKKYDKFNALSEKQKKVLCMALAQYGRE